MGVSSPKTEILAFVFTFHSQDILTYADMYQVERLLPPCEQFLLTQLHPSNALGIFLFAETHSLTDLRLQAQAFLHHHFLQVILLFRHLENSIISLQFAIDLFP